jgi:hypothetical protein
VEPIPPNSSLILIAAAPGAKKPSSGSSWKQLNEPLNHSKRRKAMFDLKVEQPINPPELSPEEQAAVDKFAELKDARIEEVVVDRMLDPEYVIGAVLTCLGDNVDTQTRMANLLMCHGDKSIHIANLKLDCMDELRRQARKEAERGML